MKAVSRHHHSITLSWEEVEHETPVSGYIISYRSHSDTSMEEVKVSGRRSSHALENLRCGTKYQLTVTAFNKIGRSDPSQVLSVSTTGDGKSTSQSYSTHKELWQRHLSESFIVTQEQCILHTLINQFSGEKKIKFHCFLRRESWESITKEG